MHERAAELQRLADEAFVDQLLRTQRAREEAELQRHLVDAFIRRQGAFDFFRFRQRNRQWFVAVNVLSMRHCAQNGILVEIVRRADVNDIDVRILRDFAIIRNAFRIQKLCCRRGRFRTARADVGNLRLERQLAKEERQIFMRERMDFANITETNDTDAIRFHRLSLYFLSILSPFRIAASCLYIILIYFTVMTN